MKWTPVPISAATTIGSVGLTVTDSVQSLTDFQDNIGFALRVQDGGKATLGINMWNSAGRGPRLRAAARRDVYTIVVPAVEELQAIRARASAAGDAGTEPDDAWRVHDPSSNLVLVQTLT